MAKAGPCLETEKVLRQVRPAFVVTFAMTRYSQDVPRLRRSNPIPEIPEAGIRYLVTSTTR
jgi:hypothetical protein